MKFFDTVKITIHSGAGGDGVVAARREAKVPFGGPSGGNGGTGGSIIFVGNKHENTLLKYVYHRDYRAENGKPGQSKDKYGADGDDLFLTVPLGTIIKDADTGHILHQILVDGEQWTHFAGGQGGIGNMHFKTATLQYPEFALLGEPGRTQHIILELQMLGDVALIGTPSVGKSTLINSCSNAKAKVAAYHFTTLVPNLGMVHHNSYDFAMVDIPGLIQGAHDGKGLGNAFLRHILKAHVFCFVQDLSLYDAGIRDSLDLLLEVRDYVLDVYRGSERYGEPIDDVSFHLELVNEQLHLKVYLHIGLEKKLFLDKLLCFVFNKYDLIADLEVADEYVSEFLNQLLPFLQKEFGLVISDAIARASCFVVSGATKYGVDEWLTFLTAKLRSYDFHNEYVMELVEKHDEKPDMLVDITEEAIPILVERGLLQESDVKFVKVWLVNHTEVIRSAFMTMWGNDQGEQWFWRKLQSIGFVQYAEEVGVKYGDVIKIPKGYYDVGDERYIQWML